jgi:NifB/MoaA-like Fe-S oxidoreductase
MDWNDIQLLDRVVSSLEKLGYKIVPTKYGYGNKSEIGVISLNDKNPIYSRDAEVFTGSLEEISVWIRGVQHQNNYLLMLKATTERRIKILEEKYVKNLLQKAMLQKIKDPDQPLDKHTRDLIDLQNK